MYAARRIVELIMATSPAGSSAPCIRVSEDCPALRQGPHRVEAQYLFRKEGCPSQQVYSYLGFYCVPYRRRLTTASLR